LAWSEDEALRSDFKQAMRRLAASVTLVSAFDRQGRPQGLMVSSCTSLTLEPPAILVCINATASIWPVIADSSHFGASVLHSDSHDEAELFVDKQRRSERFVGAHWNLESKAPLLHKAQASLLCRRADTIAYKTHHIVIGEVLTAEYRTDVDPLVYSNGTFQVASPLRMAV
jgi:flavin reductase (DIM6/NTAB) family NADH-FMN oxidoreductase RutF